MRGLRNRAQKIVARGKAVGIEPIGDLLASPALWNRGQQTALDLAAGQHLHDVVGRHRAAQLVVAGGETAPHASLFGGEPKGEPGADQPALLQVRADVARGGAGFDGDGLLRSVLRIDGRHRIGKLADAIAQDGVELPNTM